MAIGEKNEGAVSPSRREGEHGAQAGAGGTAQLVCPNCGGGFDADETRCPYCGELNIPGAEKAYMDALDDLREGTDDLADDAQDDLESNLRQSAKRTVIIAIVAVAVLVALFSAVTYLDKSDERSAIQGYQAREAFRTNYFEEFDRLYDAGDDDALSAYVWSLMDDPGFDALFSWEHVGFLEVHDGWETLRSAAGDIEAGTCGLDDYTWLVSLAFQLAQIDVDENSRSASLSPEDEQRAAPYRAYAHQFLQDVLQMNEEEVVAFADKARDVDGRIRDDELKNNLEARLKQLGALR